MKKILLFTIMALLTVASAVAQTTTLSYQAVVRDAYNKFVQDSDIPVDISITTEGAHGLWQGIPPMTFRRLRDGPMPLLR